MKPGWFGPKHIGFGVSPKSWQGWAIVVVWTALLVLAIRYCSRPLQAATGLPGPLVNAGLAIVWLAALLGIVALTYVDDRNPRDRK
ncbi:MAG: hypothetical protein ABI740_10735 [Alphaproteobacteria bacterium]